jgi:virginiamycin A acetyltransferase
MTTHWSEISEVIAGAPDDGVAESIREGLGYMPSRASVDGLKRSRLSPIIVTLYRLLNAKKRWTIARGLFNLLKRLEGGRTCSRTMRELLAKYHGVEVGAYSYGECMIPGVFPKKVTIGRYCSIGPGVRVYNQNHPLDHLSTHPFFYEPAMGLVAEELPRKRLFIGHDVWIGANAIITPGCSRIGNGAIIGAGAIVTKDVDDFAIVAGNPAKLIRYRFPEETRRHLLASRWWEKPLADCARVIDSMTRPVPEDALQHPLVGSR